MHLPEYDPRSAPCSARQAWRRHSSVRCAQACNSGWRRRRSSNPELWSTCGRGKQCAGQALALNELPFHARTPKAHDPPPPHRPSPCASRLTTAAALSTEQTGGEGFLPFNWQLRMRLRWVSPTPAPSKVILNRLRRRNWTLNKRSTMLLSNAPLTMCITPPAYGRKRFFRTRRSLSAGPAGPKGAPTARTLAFSLRRPRAETGSHARSAKANLDKSVFRIVELLLNWLS